MTFVGFLIALCLALDGLWAGISGVAYPLPSKPAAREWVVAYEPAFEAVGLESKHKTPIVTMLPLGRALGGTSSHPKRGCNQTIALNVSLLDKKHVTYGTPEWIATVGHEMAHVYQGVLCTWALPYVESSAELAQLAVLAYMAEQGDEQAYAALVYTLRRSAILATLSAGEYEVLDRLELSQAERAYFEGLDPDYLRVYGNLYWTRTLEGIYSEMFAGDGKYTREEHWIYWGDLDASFLHAFIESILEK